MQTLAQTTPQALPQTVAQAPAPARAARRIGVLFIGSPLFAAAGAQELTDKAGAFLATLGDTPGFTVAPQVASDRATLAQALEQLVLPGLDGLVVQMATFAGAELLHELVAAIGPRDLPLALWALEERDEIVSNSLCGVQLWMSTLQRLRRRPVFLLGNPYDAHTGPQLRAFAAAARAASAIAGARIALVGAHADWFTNLAVDPVVLHRRLGCTLVHTSLPKFMAACLQAPPPTAEDVARWADVAFDGGDEAARRQTVAATYARLRAGLDSLHADAVALRDWPEILYADQFKGTWSALGELSERAVPIAPEGDVMGAVTALAVRAFDPAALPFLTDISGIDRENDHLVTWHYGVSPRLAVGPRRIDEIMKQESFAPRPGPMTLIRLSLQADERLRLFVTEGRIEARRSSANRTAGLFTPQRAPAPALMRRFVEEGFEHHVTAVHGSWAAAAERLAWLLRAELVHV